MGAQLELRLAKDGPEIGDEEIAALMTLLDKEGGWVKAREFPGALE